jgi:hypothetical protein
MALSHKEIKMKITKTTIKSFVKKNFDKLHIKKLSSFDGMVDCVMPIEDTFNKAQKSEHNLDYTIGIKGAWFCGGESYTPYNDNGFMGYRVYNVCGSFILAIPSEVTNA